MGWGQRWPVDSCRGYSDEPALLHPGVGTAQGGVISKSDCICSKPISYQFLYLVYEILKVYHIIVLQCFAYFCIFLHRHYRMIIIISLQFPELFIKQSLRIDPLSPPQMSPPWPPGCARLWSHPPAHLGASGAGVRLGIPGARARVREVSIDPKMDEVDVMENPLVGGLVAINFLFPCIGLLIIPTDEILFFRGVAQAPTSYKWSETDDLGVPP